MILQFLSPLQVNIEKQVYVHTMENFIGVFGGYLGLFLGGSLIGFLECVESSISKAIFLFKSKTKK